METLILTSDIIVVMVVLYFSYKGESVPGKPELGPFRIRSRQSADKVAKPAAPGRGVRRL